MAACNDSLLHELLKEQFASNVSRWGDDVINGNGCYVRNGSDNAPDMRLDDAGLMAAGLQVYAFLTPPVMVLGILGNTVSLRVFTSKFMRRLSSSYYLVTLSASHLLVLLSYVLLEWLNKGLPQWPGGHRVPVININVVCHLFLYFSYTSRFVSTWVIVLFSLERFTAICLPTYRRKLCSKRSARRLIVLLLVASALLCLYKPLLSGVHRTNEANPDSVACTRDKNHARLIFVLDSIYGFTITALPFLIIPALNVIILRRMLYKNTDNRGTKLVFRENKLRLEFTVILLAISSCFIGLNLPYLVIWCLQFWQSMHPGSPQVAERISGQLHIARTIFYINYCINFFLYCSTGAYYRREIKSIFRYYFTKEKMTLGFRTVDYEMRKRVRL